MNNNKSIQYHKEYTVDINKSNINKLKETMNKIDIWIYETNTKIDDKITNIDNMNNISVSVDKMLYFILGNLA